MTGFLVLMGIKSAQKEKKKIQYSQSEMEKSNKTVAWKLCKTSPLIRVKDKKSVLLSSFIAIVCILMSDYRENQQFFTFLFALYFSLNLLPKGLCW